MLSLTRQSLNSILNAAHLNQVAWPSQIEQLNTPLNTLSSIKAMSFFTAYQTLPT
jgi:hypothetical protein